MGLKKNEYYFLKGGGEMGELIRAKDWSKTPMGDPATWPQSLRTMVSVLMDNPFGMYIAWGKEFTQIYNDGYRPILGSTKHPQALGLSTRETFAEIWHIIESMFEGVMDGVPIGFPDFMLPLNRDGFVENCYFDFAYSPIRMENGAVGGVLVTVIETTNKKKAEDELKKSEEKFKTLADNIPNLAWMANADGWIYWYNKKWYSYTGTTPDQMEGWGWQSVHDPNELPRVMDQWKNSLATGEPFEMIFPLRGKNQKFRQFLTRVSPVRNNVGEIIQWFGTNTDITVQKETEEALKESKNELEFVIEAAQLGTFDYNPFTNKFSANKRLKEWFGLPPDKTIELPLAMRVIAETDSARVADAIQKALEYSSGGKYDIEYTVINPNSYKEIIVHAKGRAWFNEERIAYRLNGTVEDVTNETIAQRKTRQSEQVIRNMVLEAPIGICLLDATTLVSEIVNERFVEIVGKPLESIVGKQYWDAFKEVKASSEKALANVIKTGVPYYANEVAVQLLREGKAETLYVTFVYCPVKEEFGTVTKVAVWAVDNTPQVVARQKVIQSERNLRLMILQAPVAISILRGWDYTVEIANKHALELWGRTEQQVLGKPIFSAMPELLEQGIKDLLDAVRNTGNHFTTDELPVQILRNKILETRYINFSYEPLYDGDGNINGIMAIGFDITAQVETRKIIEESEERYHKLIYSSPSAIGILYGEDLVVTIANDAILEIWGKGREIIGKAYFEALPELAEQGYREVFAEVYKTGVPFNAIETPVEIVQNGERTLKYYNFLLYAQRNIDGKINGIGIIASEVTTQALLNNKIKESEQSVRALVESAPFPIGVYTGTEMRIAFANQSIMDVWGKGNDVVGKLYKEVLPELENQQIFEQVQGVLTSGIPFHAKNQRVDLMKNGELKPYYFNYSFTPLLDTDGKVYGVMNTAADVTELHEAKQKVEESEKRFRDSVKQAPLGITILRGPEFIAEIANENYLLLVDKTEDEFIGKPLFESLPHARVSIENILREILRTGIPFYGNEFPVTLNRHGKNELTYFNFVYHPLKEDTGEISGIMVVAIEVTANVFAKHLLEESEKHFRNMVMQSPIPMTILRGKDYIIESANTVMIEEIWRKKEDDVFGKSILEVFPELKKQKYHELLHEVYTSGKAHNEKEAVAWVEGNDGMKKFYLDFQYAPLFEPDGSVSGIMITVNDVTDKVEARIKVEENQQRLNIIIEASELGIWEYDLQTEKMVNSERLLEIFGISGETHVPREELISRIHKDDLPIRKHAFEIALKTGQLHYEVRIILHDKSIRWIEAKGKVFYNTLYKPTRLVGTIRDISDERHFQQMLIEREEKFRLLADSMPQHIWTADPQGNLNYFNQTFFNFSGVTMVEIEREGWREIVHPDDQDESMNRWIESITTGNDFVMEHRFRKHDGEYRWQLSRAVPQRDQNGKIKMWVGTSSDIQDQKMFTTELERQVTERTKELNRKNNDLEIMNRELQSFAYISSHDLQEPLRKIQTFASQIIEKESKNLTENGKSRFLRIQNSAYRMQTLIQDLLAYSRTNSEEKKFERIALATIIEEVKDDLKEEIFQKQASIILMNSVTLNIVHFQFRQLLYNLISNALKFVRDSTTPVITINSEIASGSNLGKERFSENTIYTHISIMDNGIGFEQKYGDKIFEVFQRLHTKEKYEGTGIGLAIVKKIVENHNGFITAKGELNNGATFDIYIPA